jgi:ribosome maturation factor RimP
MGSVPVEEPLQHVRAIADRVARGYGLEIFDVQLRRESIGWVLRIFIDRPAPGTPGGPSNPADESVTVDDCQRVSHDVSAILDVDDPLDHAYTLEVSSPGLDRPLRHAGDYRRFTGRLAKIVVSSAIGGQKHFRGRIRAVDDESVEVEAKDGRVTRIPLADVSRANLEVEF